MDKKLFLRILAGYAMRINCSEQFGPGLLWRWFLGEQGTRRRVYHIHHRRSNRFEHPLYERRIRRGF